MSALAEVNLVAAWVGMLLGMLTGAVVGLGFHRPQMLGGYDAWPRRLVRLGHISFFGLAFVNLAFVVTADRLGTVSEGTAAWLSAASWLLVAGAALMPAVCFLSAWRMVFRRLFFLPVGSLVGGAACVVVAVALRGAA